MTIPAETYIGQVALTIPNLERSLKFYTETIGLQVQQQEAAKAVLGVGERPLLQLSENPSAAPLQDGTGLYHFAILVPSRLELANVLHHLAEVQTPLHGFADHFVSEAIYLPDPDGNGIEIYADRPRSSWEYRRGGLNIGTVALDINNLMTELNESPPVWRGLHPETVMGHVHLYTINKDQAEAFYREVLGFDLVARMSWAMAFLSAGGYHHHIAIRHGAAKMNPQAIGLQWYSVQLPNATARDIILDRLTAAEVPFDEHPQGVLLHDPAGNGIVLTV